MVNTSEAEIMEKYTLTPQEFEEFYSFYLASFADHFFDYLREKTKNKARKYITFEIGLPEIHEDDVVGIYSKIYPEKALDLEGYKKVQNFEKITHSKNFSFEIILSYSSELRSEEKKLTQQMIEKYQIPEKFAPLSRSPQFLN